MRESKEVEGKVAARVLVDELHPDDLLVELERDLGILNAEHGVVESIVTGISQLPSMYSRIMRDRRT